VGYVSGGKVEVVLYCCGRQHGVDDGWGMAGVMLDFAADGAPAQGDGVRDGEDATGKTGFQRRDRLLDAETKLATGREIGDSFAVLP